MADTPCSKPPSHGPAERLASSWALFAAVLANLIWASAYSATAVALISVPPSLLTVIRLGLGAAALSPFLKLPPAGQRGGKAAWQIVGLGLVGFSLPVLLQTAGQALTNAATAALTVALESVATVAMGGLFLRQRLSLPVWMALAAAAAGAWAVAGLPTPARAGSAGGDLLLVLAVVCYAAYTVLSVPLGSRLGPLSATAWVMVAGFLTAVPLWLLDGHPWAAAWSGPVVGALAFVGLLGTAGAYLLWMVAVTGAPVAVAAFSLYLQPMLGVGAAMLFLGIRPAWTFYLGATLIALALLVLRSDRALVSQNSSSAS